MRLRTVSGIIAKYTLDAVARFSLVAFVLRVQTINTGIDLDQTAVQFLDRTRLVAIQINLFKNPRVSV